MFEPMFMRLALVASMAIGMTLGVLGVYLVMRRIVFFGLVLANAATLGAAVAEILGWPQVVASLVAGVAASAVMGRAGSSTTRVSDEALLGWAYAAAASATVLILSRAAAGNVDTLHLLFGNVLAIEASHVVIQVILAAAVALLQLFASPRFLLVTFDAEAATVAGVNTRMWSLALNLSIGIAAATAVHEIGALSTFALLALPPMAALLVTRSIKSAFVVAAALGAGVPALALIVSYRLDLPAGPACVALLVVVVALAAVGARLMSTLTHARSGSVDLKTRLLARAVFRSNAN